MKKALLVTAAGSLLVIAGCSQQSQIESAINKNLKTQPLCLNISSTIFAPYGMDSLVLQKMRHDNAAVVVNPITNGAFGATDNYSELNNTRLEALVKAGLLTKTIKTLSAFNPTDQKPISNITFSVSFYNLTDAGQKTVQDKPASLPGDKSQNILCYAQPQVESIISTTEHTISGQKQVTVHYQFKYSNVADWINKPEIKAAFPDIPSQLNTPNKTATIYLGQTSDGWVPITPRFN